MIKFRLSLLFLILVLTGAGCLGFGGDKKNNLDGGVFKTKNFGEIWQQTVAVPGLKGVGTIGGRSIVTMEMDPQDHEIIYLGTKTSGLLYSEDAGLTWRQPKLAGLKTGQISSLAINPKDMCTIYIAKGPRLYKTEDCLHTANDEAYVETRSQVVINQVKIDWFNPQVVWLGLSNGDVLKSTNGGQTWRTVLNTKNKISDLILNNHDSRIVLVATDKDGLYKTSDGGENWKHIEKELKEFRNANRVYRLAQDKKSQVVLMASKFGLLRSEDFGDSWQSIDLLTAAGQVTIKALTIDSKDIRKFYYTALNTFYSTQDNGRTWTTHEIPTTKIPNNILIDPINTSVLYVGTYIPVKK